MPQERLLELSLQLVLCSLSYDFIGTTFDEASEELGTIQVPSSWRCTMEEPSTTRLFFEIYSSSHSSCCAAALEAPPPAPIQHACVSSFTTCANSSRMLHVPELRTRPQISVVDCQPHSCTFPSHPSYPPSQPRRSSCLHHCVAPSFHATRSGSFSLLECWAAHCMYCAHNTASPNMRTTTSFADCSRGSRATFSCQSS